MGMLHSGQWCSHETASHDGVYRRPGSAIVGRTIAKYASNIAMEPGRCWLIGSSSCPWSHRAMLVRTLRSIRGSVPLHLAHGARIEGYALDGGVPWRIPGSDRTARHMHELYTVHDPEFTGRVTVPILWDGKTQTILSNDSANIVQILDAVPQTDTDFTLRPDNLARRIDEANDGIHRGLNNAVYQAGFAQSQAAYDTAVATVFQTLDSLEERLSLSRFYFGNRLTETDMRLFPTLVRFDAIYAILFKCCLRRLVDYENLWAYARDLYGWRGIESTVDFRQMREASYLADSSDKNPVVAIAPDIDWRAPHDRSRLGAPFVTARTGTPLRIDPATLEVAHPSA
ncbi:MAG: glutathione S-transferase C-terminal domain-containing protein [Alphaproteobacteria bacterium]|nr:glutathione S-transferase C-terminal domain-containing protein [Alphaproteobacteria bacterium]